MQMYRKYKSLQKLRKTYKNIQKLEEKHANFNPGRHVRRPHFSLSLSLSDAAAGTDAYRARPHLPGLSLSGQEKEARQVRPRPMTVCGAAASYLKKGREACGRPACCRSV